MMYCPQVKSGERYGALVTDNVNSEYRHIDETIPCLYLQVYLKIIISMCK